MFNRRSSGAGGCRGWFPSRTGRWRWVGVGLSLLAGSTGGTSVARSQTAARFPSSTFASLALNEFCRVAGSPGQAFPPPVLSSQGTAGDCGGRGFPVFPSQARGRRKPQGMQQSTRAAGSAGGRLLGSALHVLRAGGRLPRCLFGKGHPKNTWEWPSSPGACHGCVSGERFAGGVPEGELRTWTHPAGKQGGSKLSVLGGSRDRCLTLLSR